MKLKIIAPISRETLWSHSLVSDKESLRREQESLFHQFNPPCRCGGISAVYLLATQKKNVSQDKFHSVPTLVLEVRPLFSLLKCFYSSATLIYLLRVSLPVGKGSENIRLPGNTTKPASVSRRGCMALGGKRLYYNSVLASE